MNQVLKTTPKQDGFYMPGEHEVQSEVWIAWPFRNDNWRLSGVPAQKQFSHVISEIANHTAVVVVVDPSHVDLAQKAISKNIRLIEMEYDDCWMRDIGATYLINGRGERRGVSWQFNAWGGLEEGLYSPWNLDDHVAEQMLKITQDDIYKAPFVLEGGSILSDGEGTLYTTEECLLNPNRNPSLSKLDIEKNLESYLGIQKIIWLPKGLYNDETNGHVDNIMHVIEPGKVALTWCDDPADPQYKISCEAYQVLCKEVDAKGRKIEVHKLPLPGPLYMTEFEAESIVLSDSMVREPGERLAASYANFLITNKLVLYPLLDEKTDAQAAEIFKAMFPNYCIVGIPAREILLGGGNIHCITQHVPYVGN